MRGAEIGPGKSQSGLVDRANHFAKEREDLGFAFADDRVQAQPRAMPSPEE